MNEEVYVFSLTEERGGEYALLVANLAAKMMLAARLVAEGNQHAIINALAVALAIGMAAASDPVAFKTYADECLRLNFEAARKNLQ